MRRDTSTSVVVESGPTVNVAGALTDPPTSEPADGVNTALSCATDAANAVRQLTVTLCPIGRMGSFWQPVIGASWLSNASVPDGWLADGLEVTFATNVTV